MVVSDDFIINEDLEIRDGDLFIGASDNQNVYAIIQANKGQFYESPLLGVGIDSFQNAPAVDRLLRKTIKQELKKDNYKSKNLEITRGGDIFTVNILPEKIR